VIRADIGIHLGGGFGIITRQLPPVAQLTSGKPDAAPRPYARLSQTPNLPLLAIVSAIFFRPNPSRVFRVGQPVSTPQPSNL